MHSGAPLLYANFTGGGLWAWDGTSWSHLTTRVTRQAWQPQVLSLYGNFTGNGIWMYNGTSWSQLTPGNPASMAASGSSLLWKLHR